MSAEAIEAVIPGQRPEVSVARDEDKLNNPSDYERLVTKFLVAPDVCQPCTEERRAFFLRAPMVWAAHYPTPADVIARLEEIVPCEHMSDNSDIPLAIGTLLAAPTTVTVEFR